MGLKQRIKMWRMQREIAEAERIDIIYHAGFAQGYDEGFLRAIAEPPDDEQPEPEPDL